MSTSRQLSTAESRRAAVLEAAAAEFALHGLAGASTVRIAQSSQIAHSYLFKLFRTKVALFLATTDDVYDRIADRFRRAALSRPTDPLNAMAKAYADMLDEKDDLRVLLHGFAAAGDPEIGPAVRTRYALLFEQVQAASNVDDERMRAFWANGMLLTVAAAIDLPQLSADHPWVHTVLSGR